MLRYPFIALFVAATLVNNLLSSCTFQSDEEFFNDIAIPDPSRVEVFINRVNLANYHEGDTIFVFGSTSFDYSLFGKHGQIEYVGGYLGTQILSGVTTNSCTIYKYGLANGTYFLKLEFLMKTGSGSLADKVGQEEFAISKQWVVKVDVSPPPQPEAELNIENGFLTMRWSAYSKPNFQSYIVKRTTPNGLSKTFEIKDINTTNWVDTSYVGGYPQALTYSVSTVTEIATATSKTLSRIDPMPVDFAFNKLDSTLTLKWKPTQFYGTFKDYKFQYEDGNDIPALTNVNDSTMTCKLTAIRFGADYYLSFTLHSKSSDIQELATHSTCKLGTPLPFSAGDKIKFNTYLNKAIVVDVNQNLLELNDRLEPVRKIATVGPYIDIPYPGNYVYSKADDMMRRLNLADNTDLTFDRGNMSQQNHNLSFASNGLVCFDYTHFPYDNQPLYFVALAFDSETNLNVYYKKSSTRVEAVISPDGQFLWADKKNILRISGGTTSLIASFSGSGTFKGFREDNSNEIMFLGNNNQINIYDSNTLTLIRSITPPTSSCQFWSYDVQTKNMFWTSSSGAGAVYAVNIETGETRKIPIAGDTSSSYKMYIVNGILIYDGTFIKLD
jgi:hypothetical protein